MHKEEGHGLEQVGADRRSLVDEVRKTSAMHLPTLGEPGAAAPAGGAFLEGCAKGTVTISRAANLFDFTESQLREGEKQGLLKTDRPALSQDSKTSTGHGQYTPEELDKNAGYVAGEIPPNIDEIWKQILDEQQSQAWRIPETEHIPIGIRVDYANQNVFWRYFVSRVLRLSLLLICEDVPDTMPGWCSHCKK